MFILEIKELFNEIPELIKRAQALDNTVVEVGMFQDQGEHYSGFTYANLFDYLSRGDSSKNLPPRPVLDIVWLTKPLSTSKLDRDLKKYFTNVRRSKKGKREADKIYSDLGEYYRNEAAKIFGNSPPLADNSEWTKSYKQRVYGVDRGPLIEQGDLQAHMAYKINNSVPYTYA